MCRDHLGGGVRRCPDPERIGAQRQIEGVAFVGVQDLAVQERALERRFGNAYRLYRANIPRWIPSWRSWDATDR